MKTNKLNYNLNEMERAYGQQKNREHMYEQAQKEAKELFGFFNWEYIDKHYEMLCEMANITPW